MAGPSKRTTAPKPTQEPPSPSPPPPKWHTLSKTVAYLLLAAVASTASQYNLSPVYGSIPAATFHQQGVTITALAALMISRTSLKRYVPTNIHQYIPIQAFWMITFQWGLFKGSSYLGPTYGPLVTELLTFYPLLFMVFSATAILVDDLDFSRLGPTFAEAAPGIFCYVPFSFSEKLVRLSLPHVMGTTDFFTRSGLQLLIASLYAGLCRSPFLLIPLPSMLHTMFANPHYNSHYAIKALNRTLAEQNFTLLARQDSVTGYISVLEGNNDKFRVMRCDHSLLGGEWDVTPERAEIGQTRKETIYSVFTMLESVRLVERETPKADAENSALFIGLGVGTSPSAFIAHGINTTIVELDPMVHYYATQYFDLLANHTAVIEDAVPFVTSAAAEHPKSYDFIIHDVFTGGAEPTALFTFEFLTSLAALLKDDGVIAINYAGDMALPPPHIVLRTINAVFPTCRHYRDTSESESDTTFINMVVFCTPHLDRPLTFRRAVPRDHLGSLSRAQFVPPPASLEIVLPELKGGEAKYGKPEELILHRGGEQVIEKWHREAAGRHWRIMRTVLPDAVWENW
ncbi:S-adenosyl-L-methionine-dependent methyltransferase [Trichodelitschia bisporula]|uniref:S-adenosyl-L-methionine-dependent methyltransferase n=1 Tax=Trichodelitschia bisporula TaxID=703511 RepID=A0A6G1HQG2_9PEZI|nr:S-adenosyl-L-methionine-dependent methyltransferase [Trichodelitschia bisporula]